MSSLACTTDEQTTEKGSNSSHPISLASDRPEQDAETQMHIHTTYAEVLCPTN